MLPLHAITFLHESYVSIVCETSIIREQCSLSILHESFSCIYFTQMLVFENE